MRRKEGFIDVDKMLNDIGVDRTDINGLMNSKEISVITYNNWKIILSFIYDDDMYFYKYNGMSSPYNELVAEELAKDFGIDHISYDLAIFNEYKGVVSKNFKKDNKTYIKLEEVINDFFKDNKDIEVHNNLEDIWDALEYRYNDLPNKREIIERLIKKIVDIFIFDIIICNYDRNLGNWQIVENKGNVDITPIYDNEGMLTISGKGAFISMTIDEQVHGNLWEVLRKFQSISNEDYSNLIKEKLWIISDNNLESIFKRIEDRTGYPISQDKKDYYLRKYQSHRNRLEKVLEDNENIRKR